MHGPMDGIDHVYRDAAEEGRSSLYTYPAMR